MACEGWTKRILLAAAVTLMGSGGAWSGKLDKAACAAIASEIESIASTGLREDMERGPEWARANMPPERLEKVRRLLELGDQLEFRCPGRLKSKKPEQTVSPAAPVPPAVSSAPSTTIVVPERKATKEAPPAGALKASAGSHIAPAMQAPASNSTSVQKPATQAIAPVVPAAARSTPSPAATADSPAPRSGSSAGGVSPSPARAGTASAVGTQAVRAFKPAPPPSGLGIRPAQQPAVSPASPAKMTPPVAPSAAGKSAVAAPLQGTREGAGVPVPTGAPAAVAAKPAPAAAPVAGTAPVAPTARIAPVPATAAIGPTPGPSKPIAPEEVAPEPEKRAAEAAARKKSAWRKPSSAYVSPSEVSPFMLPGMR